MECEPIGIMLQREDNKEDNNKEDNNILAVLKGETVTVDDEIKKKLTEFVKHVFDILGNKKIDVGGFLGKEEAINLIKKCADKT